jgi:hypothetical protein
MSEQGKPYLGVCRVPGDEGRARDFIGKVALTEAEFKRYSEAAFPFARLTLRVAWGIVERNYRELETRARFYGELFGERRPRGLVTPQHAAYSVMTDVANWLTGFSLYLWHRETEYRRRFGDDSPQLQRFKKVCARCYDNSRDYRITYQLRNYAQHCGLPVRRVEVVALGDGITNFGQRIGFVLDRDQLLREYDWKRVAADVSVMPPTFDVLPVIESTMDLLRTIEQEALRIDLEEVVRVAPTLREALKRLGESDGLPRLFRFTKPTDDELNTNELPIPTSEDLARIEQAVGEKDPAEYMRPQFGEVPTEFLESAEQARRMALGVELMSVWLAEGGLTERVVATVDDLVQREASAEPVVTGALQVAAYALALASLAVGTSSESFLGSLAESTDPPNG